MKLSRITNVFINILLFVIGTVSAKLNHNETDAALEKTDPTTLYNSMEVPKLLSRRKRFIVFPDGSSFQLVFCTQTPGYLQIGDIVWFGNTAALAWELPSDPKMFHFLKDYNKIDVAQRRVDEKNMHYVDSNGELIATMPNRKKFIVNPAFAKRKRSLDYGETRSDRDAVIDSVTITRMHKMKKDLNILKCEETNECNTQFHREGRMDLYEHLEKLLDALPGGHNFVKDSHKEYDAAHTAAGECNTLYPACRNRQGESLFM